MAEKCGKAHEAVEKIPSPSKMKAARLRAVLSSKRKK